jgi:hypothetical protein
MEKILVNENLIRQIEYELSEALDHCEMAEEDSEEDYNLIITDHLEKALQIVRSLRG